MTSQDLILSSRPFSSALTTLSPLNIGVSALLGPQFTSSTSFGADLLSRLLFMIFERIIRGIEGLARTYLDKFANGRAKLMEERGKVTDKVVEAIEKGKEEMEEGKLGVMEAVNELHARQSAASSFPPGCPISNGAATPFEPPFFVKFFHGRRQKWMEWREERQQFMEWKASKESSA